MGLPTLGALVTGLVLFILLALGVRAGPLFFDRPLSEALHAPEAPVVAALDLLVGLPVWSTIVVGVAVLLWRSHRIDDALLLASGLSVEVATAATKLIVDRARPLAPGAGDLIATTSFPSGHVTRAVVALGLFTVILGRIRPSLRAPFLALATLFLVVLAMARIASGEHWPSDVLGGLLLGAIWLRLISLGVAIERRAS